MARAIHVISISSGNRLRIVLWTVRSGLTQKNTQKENF